MLIFPSKNTAVLALVAVASTTPPSSPLHMNKSFHDNITGT